MLNRRRFLAASGLAAAAGASWDALARAPDRGVPPLRRRSGGRRAGTEGWLFFDDGEIGFIEAACACILPGDRRTPGALDAEVPRYIDRELAGDWGSGAAPYRGGPWLPGPSAQPPGGVAPAGFFRAAIAQLRRPPHVGAFGDAFEDQPPSAQERLLRSLADGPFMLGGAPSAVFLHMLLALTLEGFFGHPTLGATRDLVPWSLPGIVGSHAATSFRIR